MRTVLADVLAATNRPLTRADRERITQDIADDILGYGPLEPYLRDDDVAEVMVNGPFDIWLERKGKLVKVDGKFKDEAHLRRTIDKIVSRIGRRVDESSPMVDARLPDGSRVNAVVPPLAIDGSTLTIRKFSADPLTVNDLIKFGSLSDRTADFLDACVRGRLNVVVSGGTGAGKTTTLNVLSSFIPSDERIVTIEDAAELQLKQDHVVRLESRPANIEGKGEVTIRDLVRNSLRMRPDRIVVGEVRDASALDMLQAMNTGHDGSICTVHSNGPRDTCSRLETLVLMAGMDLPVRAIREQVASAVDLIVHQARLKDGTRRITHVTEVERMEGDVITLQDIFLFDNSAGFDSEGRSLGTPEGDRPAPEVPGEDAAQQRHRRPAGLRHHGLPMTRGVRRLAARASSAVSWDSLAARPPSSARRRRARPRTATPPSTTPSRPRAPCACWSRFPATDAIDSTTSRSASTTRTSRPMRPPPRRAPTCERTSILAIDTSNSMAGTRIAEAKRAALAYLPRSPPTSRSASSRSTTTSRRWSAAHARPGRGSPCHQRADPDARHCALRRGHRRAQGSRSGRRQRRPAQDPDPLRRQGHHQHEPRGRPRRRSGSGATSTWFPAAGRRGQPAAQRDRQRGQGHRAHHGGPRGTHRRLPSEADALARQIVVTAEVPDGLDEHQLQRRGERSDRRETYTTAAYVPVRSAADLGAAKAAAAAPQPVQRGSVRRSPRNVVLGGVGAIGVGLLGVIVVLAAGGQARRRRTSPCPSRCRRTAPWPARDRRVRARDDAADRLHRAGSPGGREGAGQQQEPRSTHRHRAWRRQASRCSRPSGCCCARRSPSVAALVGLLIGAGSIFLGVLIFVAGAIVGPWIYLRIKRSRRLKAFGTGLADTLQLMSGSLSAGLSLAQSIDTIVREGTEPITSSSGGWSIESRLGVDPRGRAGGRGRADAEPGLQVGRDGDPDPARGRRQPGRAAATVAATLREREYLRRHVQALSAEGRLSCCILGGLPPGFLLYLALSKPDYVQPMFTHADRLDPASR